jgi:hypothetical protein
MKVGEFFYELGIDAKPGKESVDGFIKSILELKAATVLTGFGLGTLEEFFRGSIISSSQAAVNFQKFTNQTNLAWQELQRWQIVARQANVSAETIAGGLFNLQMNLAAFRRGEGPIEAFTKLGLDPGISPFKAIDELRRLLKKGYPIEQMTGLIQGIGFGPDWMNILRLPDDEYSSFQKTAMGMTTGGEQSILEMTKSWNELWLAMNDVKILISEIMSGPIGEILHVLARIIENAVGNGGIDPRGETTVSGIDPRGETTVSGIVGSDWLSQPKIDKSSATTGGNNLTNNVHMSVYGDTHDERFASQVSEQVLDGTEAQLPLNESTAIVGR